MLKLHRVFIAIGIIIKFHLRRISILKCFVHSYKKVYLLFLKTERYVKILLTFKVARVFLKLNYSCHYITKSYLIWFWFLTGCEEKVISKSQGILYFYTIDMSDIFIWYIYIIYVSLMTYELTANNRTC